MADNDDMNEDIGAAPAKGTTPPRSGGTPRPGWPKEPTMPPASGAQAPPPGWYYQPHKRRSNKPQIVGAMLAIVAVLGIVFGAFGLVGFSWVADFMDEGTTDVTGRVTYLNGTGIEGAIVSIEGQSLSTSTDADGYYILYSVPRGDVEVKAEMTGFKTVIRKVTLSDFDMDGRHNGDKGETRVDFALSPGSGTVEAGEFEDVEKFFGMLKKWSMACGAIVIVLSVLVLLGAYYAFQRTNVTFVLVGAIAGIFTVGFVIGSILAFIALFVLLISMDEFRQRDREDDLYE